jgi:hypothetical protein
MTTFGTFDIDSVPSPSDFEWHSIQRTDPKPVGKLTHVCAIRTCWGWQCHRWVDEAGQLWDIVPGQMRVYAGQAEEVGQ